MATLPVRLSPTKPGTCSVCHAFLSPEKVWNRVYAGLQREKQMDLCQQCSDKGYTFWNETVCAIPGTEAAIERRFPIRIKSFTGRQEWVKHSIWDAYAKRIEKNNLQVHGRSLTFSGIASRANGFIITIQNDRQGKVVYKGWREAMRLETPKV